MLAQYRATIASIVTAYMYICNVSIHTHTYQCLLLWIIGQVYHDLVVVVVVVVVVVFEKRLDVGGRTERSWIV